MNRYETLDIFINYVFNTMKPVIITHPNQLLEDFESLNATKPDTYAGFVYLWKCIPEDMFYVGSHKGPINDDYRGSGRRFKKVFEHYGITNFKRVILEYVDDPAQIKIKEQEWMNKLKVSQSSRFYNLNKAVRSLST